jgi:hypothetical protein
MSTDWKRHFTRREGASFGTPFSDKMGYHFSIRYRDVTSCTGMLTLPTETEQNTWFPFSYADDPIGIMLLQIIKMTVYLTLW